MSERDKMRERAKARKYWESLDRASKNDLGDALVLGTFDWLDWFTAKPSAAFMNELGTLHVLWEC